MSAVEDEEVMVKWVVLVVMEAWGQVYWHILLVCALVRCDAVQRDLLVLFSRRLSELVRHALRCGACALRCVECARPT